METITSEMIDQINAAIAARGRRVRVNDDPRRLDVEIQLSPTVWAGECYICIDGLSAEQIAAKAAGAKASESALSFMSQFERDAKEYDEDGDGDE